MSCWRLLVNKGPDMTYLVFRLYGPLASWGEVAVGESRHSAAYPSKSALLGLLGAALGIRRDQTDTQTALNNGYQFAVKMLCNGTLLRDYHTTQVPDSVGKRVYRTRRDELVFGQDRLGTVLSSREYRCDSKALIAVTANADAPFSLAQLKEALLRPKFQLSLGRKACVLAAPLAPDVVEADGYKAALDRYAHADVMAKGWLEERWLPDDAPRYYWEGDRQDLAADLDLSTAQQLTRHDMPVSRERWQFKPRQEWYWQEVTV